MNGYRHLLLQTAWTKTACYKNPINFEALRLQNETYFAVKAPKSQTPAVVFEAITFFKASDLLANYFTVFVGLFHTASLTLEDVCIFKNMEITGVALTVLLDIFFFCSYWDFFSRLKVEAPAAKKMKTAASNGSSGHPKQPNIMNFFKKK